MPKTLLETRSLPSAWGTRQRPYCTRQRLCRVPHSAKSKRQSHIRRRVLCRVPFVGHLAKALPSARTVLGKENWPSAVDGVFAECRVRKALGKGFFLKNIFFFAECRVRKALSKAFPFFFEKSFAECLPDPALVKEKNIFF